MKKILFTMLLVVSLSINLFAKKIQVVTTLEDIASITREVGGDKVEVTAIARGYQDPHFVDAKPSYLIKLQKADLFIEVGRDLEVGWAPPLLNSARNSKILLGADGFLDVSVGCKILEIPTGQISRAEGDVHPFGNPHYWLDPDNGRKIAENITEKLCQINPQDCDSFNKNLKIFKEKLSQAEIKWDKIMEPFKGTKIITYHKSWPNFAKRWGFEVVDYVEPRPGIPPTPKHIQSLIEKIKTQNIKLLIVEPYFDVKLPQKIASETGAKLLILPPSVGGEKSITNYFELFDYDLKKIEEALK